MIITYYGHSMFQIEMANGKKILIDPFDAHVGYPVPKLYPDYISVSHQHADHNNTKDFAINDRGEAAKVFDRAGSYDIEEKLTLRQIPTYHDNQKGALRGDNLLSLIKVEGLTFLHLGDLGEDLAPALIKQIGPVDILCLPVGGYYTIDAGQAKALLDRMNPAITIPMHYKTQYNEDFPITLIEDFLSFFPQKAEKLPLLRITKEDLSQQPSLVVLDVFVQK